MDPLFQPGETKRTPAADSPSENRFALVFDERVDGPQLQGYLREQQAHSTDIGTPLYNYENVVGEIEEEANGSESEGESGKA